MTPRRMRNGLAAGLVLAALALILRWTQRGATPIEAMLALLVLFGLPAGWWLTRKLPPDPGRRRLPGVFWVGLALVGVATASLIPALSVSPGSSKNGSPGPGYKVGEGRGQPLVRSSPPARAAAAVHAVLPGERVIEAFHTQNARYPVYELIIGQPHHLIADATWDGTSLTLNHLGWNTFFGPAPPNTGQPIAWAAIRAHIDVPAHVLAYGPYPLPGYYLWILPQWGQLWVGNRNTGDVSGGGL